MNFGQFKKFSLLEVTFELQFIFSKKLLAKIVWNLRVHFRYNHVIKDNSSIYGNSSIRNESMILAMQKEILEYEKYTDKIIFLEPSPIIVLYLRNTGNINRVLAFNHSSSYLNSLSLPRENVEQNLNDAWKAIQTVISVCKKCMTVPTLDAFCTKKKCSAVEPSGLMRYCDRSHLSPVGTNLMAPALRNALNGIL